MTTENKIPGNWQDGLKMADRIAGEVETALNKASQNPEPLFLAQDLTMALERIGNLVGWTLKKP